MVSAKKREVRRRKAWELYVLQGYTQSEVADILNISRRTVIRDLHYLDEHREELPQINEEAFAAYVQNLISRLLEDEEITKWQKLKVAVDLARSQVTRKVKKEEAIQVNWGNSSEGDSTNKQKDG